MRRTSVAEIGCLQVLSLLPHNIERMCPAAVQHPLGRTDRNLFVFLILPAALALVPGFVSGNEVDSVIHDRGREVIFHDLLPKPYSCRLGATSVPAPLESIRRHLREKVTRPLVSVSRTYR